MSCIFCNHLKIVLRHKYWVFRYALLAGIPFRGLFHDMSKFSPSEFIRSLEFYTGKRSPVVTERNIRGYSKIWLHHRGRNTHHFEYWVDKGMNGEIVVPCMPFKDALELICDWLGAGRAYLGNDFTIEKQIERFNIDTNSPFIHPHTKQFIWLMYNELANAKDNYAVKGVFKRAKQLYQKAWDILLYDGDVLGSIHNVSKIRYIGFVCDKNEN